MTDNPVLDFLLSRRSRPFRLLDEPAPDRAAVELLLTAAARSPDHGKLEPWRFVVLEAPALRRLAAELTARAEFLGDPPERTAKEREVYERSPLSVVVVASPKESDKVPQIEQVLSAGAVCLSLLNAALAAGWGANWLTGWPAHDRAFAEPAFGLGEGEFVAGIVHIGTATTAPPDRPRPDVAAITTWISD
ncbi:MAG: nitroreductase [Gemmobacter sp.]